MLLVSGWVEVGRSGGSGRLGEYGGLAKISVPVGWGGGGAVKTARGLWLVSAPKMSVPVGEWNVDLHAKTELGWSLEAWRKSASPSVGKVATGAWRNLPQTGANDTKMERPCRWWRS